MPVQRTFTIVPSSLRNGPTQPIRPMTSRQARKAYMASTRTSSLSCAELAKQEKADLERIRKEHEREKVAAKAKMARERKKEKELADRERKRKMGMPLVSVRPSQDTIARFVRGNEGGARNEESPASEDGELELDLIPEEDLERLMDTITRGDGVVATMSGGKDDSFAPPPPPPPPMSTQAILGDLEAFFPSSSQQARELLDEIS